MFMYVYVCYDVYVYINRIVLYSVYIYIILYISAEVVKEWI